MATWDNLGYRNLELDNYSNAVLAVAARLQKEHKLSFDQAIKVLTLAERLIDGDFKDTIKVGSTKELAKAIKEKKIYRKER